MKKETGAGMIEILIALVICAIGVLGLMALQTNSGKSIQMTRFHQQANMALSELSAVIVANSVAAKANQFDVNNITSGTDLTAAKDCSGVNVCTLAERASYELAAWFSSLKTQITSPRVKIVTSPENNGAKISVQLVWDANLNQWSVASLPVGDVCAAKDSNYPCIEYSLWVN